MTPNRHHILLLFVGILLLAGCSTTSRLPADELLYTGIKSITYGEKAPKAKKAEKKQKRKKKKEADAAADSVGVITAIGEAINSIENALSGNGGTGGISAAPIEEPTAEEKKAAKQYAEMSKANFDRASEEVEAVLAYPPNNALFGSSKYSSPLKFGLWLNNGFVNAKTKFGKWIHRTFATDPVLLSEVSPETRAKVATNTLHNFGYLQGLVRHEVLPQKNPKKAKVAYNIKTGPVYVLDSIAYLGYTGKADSILRARWDMRLLKKGDAFNALNLTDEQKRIETMLRQNGYYFFNSSYTTYRADTLQRKQHVQLQVKLADNLPPQALHPWYMGKTYISVREKATSPITSQLKLRSYEFAFSGEKIPLRPSVWRHAITHRRGELYRLRHQERTIEKLGALGVFSQIDVDYVPRDSSATCDTLDLVITAVMDKLYDSSFEVNAKIKSNQHVGPGVSFGLAKRNAFRGGEKVSFDIYGNYEWQTGAGAGGKSSLINSYEFGTSLTFEFPRFVFPGFHHRRLRFPSSTTFSINADWRNRAGFFGMVTFGGSATYSWHKNRYVTHDITLLSLDFDRMLHTTAGFDSIMTNNPGLALTMRNQFVPSLTYTLTYAQSSRRRHPLWLQLSFKEASSFVSAIYAACGEKWNQKDKELFGNPYAQFAKLTLETHKSWRLNRRFQIATRFFGGVVYSYGNSTYAPYTEQFYVGGANSVRGFTVRTVGPGSYRSENTKYAYLDQTGDVKLEANAEFRARLFGSLFGAIFLDVGNVWLLRDDAERPGSKFSFSNIKNMAVGSGLGLRYDLDFLVLRFDVGVALHAPYETGKSGWYNIPKFGKSLAYHFAIGYPF